MAKNYEKALADLREERMENEFEVSNSGESLQRFLDFLDASEQEKFQVMREMAEEKMKWLKKFSKMQAEIASEEFDEALDIFRYLCEDMELE